MATLSTRHEQLSTMSRTKRLFYLSSMLGLVSLVAICVTVLPWDVLKTQGQIVAFALQALGAFCWLTLSIAAVSSLQIRRRMQSAWWMLLISAVVHAAMTAYFEVYLVDQKRKLLDACTASDLELTICTTRISSLLITVPIAGAILPFFAIPLLILLYVSFAHLPQNPRYDSLMDDDEVPPGWHTPPKEFAPDSSASESEDDMADPLGVRAAGRGWYEMGKREKGGRASTMSDDFRAKWEPRIDHAQFATDKGSFEPNPAASIPLLPDRQAIVDAVVSLYCATPSEAACLKYAKESVYDDPLSYCKNREEIAGQWYGLPKTFKECKVLAHEVIVNDSDKIIIRLKAQYSGSWGTKVVTSVVVLVLAEEGGETKIKYHKDLWDEDDYEHSGFGHAFKQFNAKVVPHVIDLPDSLKQ
ncbi:hypothetical protein JCM11641_004731 [Rhodosporidiobolus odoratus]